jgi:hypothetical protein
MTIKNRGFGRKYFSSALLQGLPGAAKSSGFPVDAFDKAILLRLTTADWFAVTDRFADNQSDIEVAEERLSALDRKISEISEAAITSSSVSVVNLLTSLDRQRGEAQKHLNTLRSQNADKPDKSAISQLVDFATKVMKGNLTTEDREQLRGLMRRIIGHIDVEFERVGLSYICNASIVLTTGGVVKYVFGAERVESIRPRGQAHQIREKRLNKNPVYNLNMLV